MPTMKFNYLSDIGSQLKEKNEILTQEGIESVFGKGSFILETDKYICKYYYKYDYKHKYKFHCRYDYRCIFIIKEKQKDKEIKRILDMNRG